MSRMITIDIQGQDWRARQLDGDDGWKPAALRAVQRKYGRAASVRGWTLDVWQQDREGRTTRARYKATIVGKQLSRRDGGGWPILGEAHIWVTPQTAE